MKPAVLAIVAGALAGGCSPVSNAVFRGSAPEPTAPRVVLASTVLEQLDHAPGDSPRWDPDPVAMQRCEGALWRRAHWSGIHDELPDYAIQFAGTTKDGERVIVMYALCRSLWDSPRERSELSTSILSGLHLGGCFVEATCHPETSVISSYRLGTRGRR
jgi:hypothetical protein